MPDPGSIHIRKAAVEDAAAIARVHVRTWQSTYRGLLSDEFLDGLSIERREQSWRETLAENEPLELTLVAEEGGEVVGFANCGPEKNGDSLYRGEVYTIYVLQTAQRKGTGTELIRAAARELMARGLSSLLIWVFAENPFRPFYEALGGRLVGEQPVEIGEQTLTEVAYGWADTAALMG